MADLNNITVGCIGCGVMGGSLMKAMAKVCNKKNLFVSAVDFEEAKTFAEKNGINAVKTNNEVVEKAQYVFLAVKPAYVKEVLEGVKSTFTANTVLVSMA